MSMTTDRVLRHNKRLPKSSRYSPYTLGTKEKQKEEAYVFETYIKPKNGVYKDGGKSIQWDQFKMYSYHFAFGVRVFGSHCFSSQTWWDLVKPSGIEHYKQELKKLEENLKLVKDVSEANGFAREAIES
ncbi:hypothetical protein CARUB_v10011631mg [Capsella rubella]|uniref:Uncharacterized protein n=1 Tax=Capsella rubella TaxID=81985 RepID=R0GTD4_9BRAS|nr:hypothetical protein CARUB_v10011631mg [Capsella rubella]